MRMLLQLIKNHLNNYFLNKDFKLQTCYHPWVILLTDCWIPPGLFWTWLYSTGVWLIWIKQQQCVCAWGQLGKGGMKGTSGASVGQAFTSCWLLPMWSSTTCSASSVQAEEACRLCHLSCPRSGLLRVEGTLFSALVGRCTAEAVLNVMGGNKCGAEGSQMAILFTCKKL